MTGGSNSTTLELSASRLTTAPPARTMRNTYRRLHLGDDFLVEDCTERVFFLRRLTRIANELVDVERPVAGRSEQPVALDLALLSSREAG